MFIFLYSRPLCTRWRMLDFTLCYVVIAMLVYPMQIQGQPAEDKAFLGVNDILEGWEATYGSIMSMQVQYSETKTREGDTNYLVQSHVERIQEGKKFYVRHSVKSPSGEERTNEASFDGKISKYFDHKRKSGRVDSGPAVKGYETRNSLERYMWLSRYYYNEDYPDGETYFAFWVRDRLAESFVNDKVKVHVRPQLEQILDEMCHVIEIKRGTRGQRFWISHKKGLLPMKYEKFSGKQVTNKFEAKEVASIMTDVGEIWYPSKVERVYNPPGGTDVMIIQCDIQEFQPHIDIPEGNFSVDFPDGIKIFDKTIGMQYVTGSPETGMDDLDVPVNHLEVGRPKELVSDNKKDGEGATTIEVDGAVEVRNKESVTTWAKIYLVFGIIVVVVSMPIIFRAIR